MPAMMTSPWATFVGSINRMADAFRKLSRSIGACPPSRLCCRSQCSRMNSRAPLAKRTCLPADAVCTVGCRATFRTEMGAGIRARKGAASGPVAAPILRPFYGHAPPAALWGSTLLRTPVRPVNGYPTVVLTPQRISSSIVLRAPSRLAIAILLRFARMCAGDPARQRALAPYDGQLFSGRGKRRHRHDDKCGVVIYLPILPWILDHDPLLSLHAVTRSASSASLQRLFRRGCPPQSRCRLDIECKGSKGARPSCSARLVLRAE